MAGTDQQVKILLQNALLLVEKYISTNSDCRQLGLYLGLPLSTWEQIENDHDKIQDQTYYMRRAWQKMNGHDCSLPALIKALLRIPRKDIVDDITKLPNYYVLEIEGKKEKDSMPNIGQMAIRKTEESCLQHPSHGPVQASDDSSTAQDKEGSNKTGQEISIGCLKAEIVQALSRKLDILDTAGGWEKLGTLFGITRDKLRLIRDGGEAHRSFFDVLVKTFPLITLNNIKEKLEKGRSSRKDIFFLIDRKGGKKPDFGTPLIEIMNNAEEGDFVMANIADKLVDSNRSILCWKHLAASFNFHREKIAEIDSVGKKQDYSPTEALLLKLGAREEKVSDLINHLTAMERNDIVGYLEEQIREGNAFESPNMKKESCTL